MSERDYIERTIETVRVHRDSANSWPQWANIFADEIERLWGIEEQLEAEGQYRAKAERDIADLERERDAIGAALGEPCAECGHIEWRSDGYVDSLLEAAQHEANWWRDRASAEADKRRRLEKDRDSWEKVAREYETALSDRGLL